MSKHDEMLDALMPAISKIAAFSGIPACYRALIIRTLLNEFGEKT